MVVVFSSAPAKLSEQWVVVTSQPLLTEAGEQWLTAFSCSQLKVSTHTDKALSHCIPEDCGCLLSRHFPAAILKSARVPHPLHSSFLAKAKQAHGIHIEDTL